MLPRPSAVLVVLLPACAPDAPAPSAHSGAAVTQPAVHVATLPPIASDGSCGQVVHLVIAADGAVDAATIALVEGDVSDVALRGFRDRSPPASTRDRVVPARFVPGPGGTSLLAPARALVEGRHTLVVGSAMSRTTLQVRARAVPRLSRLFPPPEAEAPVAVHCGGLVLPTDVRGVTADGAPSTVALGVLGDTTFDRCITVQTPAGAPSPPALYSSTGMIAELDPVPLPTAASPGSAKPGCDVPLIALGPACIVVDDDRLAITAASPVLAAVHADHSAALAVLGNTPLRIRGLVPGSTITASGRFLDASGAITTAEVVVTLPDAHPHIVVNEVMARPYSSDNHAQWIELANDGTTEVDLGAWGLETSHASYVLPPIVTPPGSFPLLVDPAYATSVSDVPLPDDSLLVPLEHFAKNALLRTSEIITLVAPDGTLSRAPSKRSSPGKSLSRSEPDAPDLEASWTLAGPTPGRVNGP